MDGQLTEREAIRNFLGRVIRNDEVALLDGNLRQIFVEYLSKMVCQHARDINDR